MPMSHAISIGILNAATALISLAFMVASTAHGERVTDVYDMKMYLYVPRVYDNNQSQGYRKYQRQLVKGRMIFSYDVTGEEAPTVAITNLYNATHKVNGASVTYRTSVDTSAPVKVNVVGDNMTGQFNTPSVCFSMVAEPSYSIGEPAEDNTLYVTLSGYGRTTETNGVRVIRILNGSVAGTLGCGCTDYGHTSPTRVMGVRGATDKVDDVAAVHGVWRALWLPSKSRR